MVKYRLREDGVSVTCKMKCLFKKILEICLSSMCYTKQQFMKGFNNVTQNGLPGQSDLFITWLKLLTCWKKGVSHKRLVETVSIATEGSQGTMPTVPIYVLSRGYMDFECENPLGCTIYPQGIVGWMRVS